jgi:glycosyltransferase involved in cell wall biosynthesis
VRDFQPLRILITVDPYLPVPPVKYGGIERVVDFVVRTLIARGHTVYLAAHPASVTPATLLPYGEIDHTSRRGRFRELIQASRLVSTVGRTVDIVHSFGRLASLLPILPSRSIPKIQSYQRHIVTRSIRFAGAMAGSSLMFTACSSWMYSHRLGGEWRTVFNGVEVAKYDFVREVPADAALVFLGRLEKIKGVHTAIAIAHRAGRRLIIAGNRVRTREGDQYFEEEIAPHLDSDAITYVGELDDAAKNTLLGSAAALLMPIEWDEPFGIVMAEAMACGTPVIAFNRGSVSEVVVDGVNGFRCESVDDAARAVGRISEISRDNVRHDCERRFSAEAITDSYESLYREMIGRTA